MLAESILYRVYIRRTNPHAQRTYSSIKNLCLWKSYTQIEKYASDSKILVKMCQKGLLHWVTFGDETFWSRLTQWGHYTEGSKKFQPLVYMWSKPTPSFSHVGALLLKIRAFYWAPFSFFGTQILQLSREKGDAWQHSQPVIIMRDNFTIRVTVLPGS